MGNGIYVATSGASARERQIDVVANNVANAGTPGFRKLQVGFEEVLHRAQEPKQRHVVLTEPSLSVEAGAIEQTGRPNDLALSGPGFFVSEDDAGNELLMRTVSFRIDDGGRLLDGANRPLKMAHSGPIDRDKPVAVDPHGVVHQGGVVRGRLEVRGLFKDERGLEPVGGGAYRATERSGRGLAIETGDVVGGAIERSNVTPVESMVELITLEREFQSLTKVIQSYREADDALVNTALRT